MKKLFFALSSLLLTFNTLGASDLPVEKNINIAKYIGKWYAHYSLPQFFTRKCLAQTAEYTVINDKKISVLNTCIKENGQKTISGSADVSNPGDNSILVVKFNNFFTRLFRVKGDYRILKIDKDYKYVLVGSNNLKSLWLMSRSAAVWPTEIKSSYLDYARDLGFDVNKLVSSQF